MDGGREEAEEVRTEGSRRRSLVESGTILTQCTSLTTLVAGRRRLGNIIVGMLLRGISLRLLGFKKKNATVLSFQKTRTFLFSSYYFFTLIPPPPPLSFQKIPEILKTKISVSQHQLRYR